MSASIYISCYNSPFGEMILGEYQSRLCLLDWRYRQRREQVDERIKRLLNADFIQEETPLHQQVKAQVLEYSIGNRKEFDVPFLPVGSEFQLSVWERLTKIPFGQVKSYLQLSKELGDEKAVRAVAAANGANALALIIPCHRVIASSGDLQGYAGGIQTKRKLLELESAMHQMSFNFN